MQRHPGRHRRFRGPILEDKSPEASCLCARIASAVRFHVWITIFSLHGSRCGSGVLSTAIGDGAMGDVGCSTPDGKRWLLHKMAVPPSDTGWEAQFHGCGWGEDWHFVRPISRLE